MESLIVFPDALVLIQTRKFQLWAEDLDDPSQHQEGLDREDFPYPEEESQNDHPDEEYPIDTPEKAPEVNKEERKGK